MSTRRINSHKSHGMMIAMTLSLVLGISMGIGIVSFGGWAGFSLQDIFPQQEASNPNLDPGRDAAVSYPDSDPNSNADAGPSPSPSPSLDPSPSPNSNAAAVSGKADPPDGTADPPAESADPSAGPDANAKPSLPADPSGGEIRSYYDRAGNPPLAPGLSMKPRTFRTEPEKIVYLTFDDGPYPHSTPQILKILADEGVKATFFVLGVQVEKYPDQLKAIYDSGQGIGNHTYSHIYQELYVSPQAFLDNIEHCEDIIDRTIGIRPRIIRAPGGTTNFTTAYYNLIDQQDYLVYDWNASSDDATTAKLLPADQLVQNVINTAQGKNRVIVLMHDIDTKTTTIDALPRIIHYFREQGYEFGVLGPDVKPIMFQSGFTK